MARPQDKKRWRDRSGRKRIEVYQPVDSVTALDKLAAASGQSGAAVIVSLIEAQSAEKQAEAPGYQFRRPETTAERRYEWIVVVDGNPWQV